MKKVPRWRIDPGAGARRRAGVRANVEAKLIKTEQMKRVSKVILDIKMESKTPFFEFEMHNLIRKYGT